jgi:hypothetical protein
MKTILYFLIAFIFSLPFSMQAQLENVIVETYYIANANDTADIALDGNGLPLGSKTYRIYIDLKAGSKLFKLYGKPNHPLKFSSTADFYNHNGSEGKIFGLSIPNNALKDNTVALDSWLTLGQACRAKTGSSPKTNNGILKSQDSDGATLLVTNNDGMLLNNDLNAGIPLITADGFFSINGVPKSIKYLGNFFGLDNTNDSTAFGEVIDTNVFYGNFCSLVSDSGIVGSKPDSNQILVAQLTTTGTLSFELNIEIKDITGKIINYVSSATGNLTNDTILSPLLKYPAACGCKDPNYLEYSNTFSCSLPGACITPLVLGCMDTNACNYNPNANFNIDQLCCYVGYCNDRNLAVVCPAKVNERIIRSGFLLYTNHVDNDLNLEFETVDSHEVKYEVYNAFGRKVFTVSEFVKAGKIKHTIDFSAFEKGIYLMRVINGHDNNSQMFIKK